MHSRPDSTHPVRRRRQAAPHGAQCWAAGGQACCGSWRPCSPWRCCPRSPEHEVGSRQAGGRTPHRPGLQLCAPGGNFGCAPLALCARARACPGGPEVRREGSRGAGEDREETPEGGLEPAPGGKHSVGDPGPARGAWGARGARCLLVFDLNRLGLGFLLPLVAMYIYRSSPLAGAASGCWGVECVCVCEMAGGGVSRALRSPSQNHTGGLSVRAPPCPRPLALGPWPRAPRPWERLTPLCQSSLEMIEGWRGPPHIHFTPGWGESEVRVSASLP